MLFLDSASRTVLLLLEFSIYKFDSLVKCHEQNHLALGSMLRSLKRHHCVTEGKILKAACWELKKIAKMNGIIVSFLLTIEWFEVHSTRVQMVVFLDCEINRHCKIPTFLCGRHKMSLAIAITRTFSV